MSITNTIKVTLDIKEENIYFKDDCVYEDTINTVRSKIYTGYLSYIPDFCPKCGVVKDNKIIKHGFKPSLIKMPQVSNCNTYLKLFKQRYVCHHCLSTFTCKTDLVNENCFISNNVKRSIAVDSTKITSEKDIASDNNVSHTTVGNVIDSYFHNQKLYKHNLPEIICFDEFKSVKKCKGKMSFLFVDYEKRKPIDIVEDRRYHSLINYFNYYTPEARNNVKFIIIDMYMPYVSVIERMFPNAKIVIDKFHIINLIGRSLNKTRINLMKIEKRNYNKLKRYWRLPLKNRSKLDLYNYKKRTCFNKFMTEEQIVDYLINIDNEFKNTYWVYQKLLSAVNNRDIALFKKIVNQNHDNISHYMQTSLNTLRNYQDYVANALATNYTNGVIEGINNKIKVIKRVSFGYKNYDRFKKRILICFNLIKQKEHQII